VLASLQNINSATDVEQLLGRVLRMPYAKLRQNDELNKAYAHVISSSIAQATMLLKDRMIQNMGLRSGRLMQQLSLNLSTILGLEAMVQQRNKRSLKL
jgi:type III restriction enzyme